MSPTFLIKREYCLKSVNLKFQVKHNCLEKLPELTEDTENVNKSVIILEIIKVTL